LQYVTKRVSNSRGIVMADFLTSYKLVAATLRPGVGGKSMEERCRTKMLRMIALQKSGKAKRNWFRAGDGVTLFVPRYANVPLATALGQGKKNAWVVAKTEAATLRDFAKAVKNGEFDAALVKIASARSKILAGARRKRG
jgi:hypothetical protein